MTPNSRFTGWSGQTGITNFQANTQKINKDGRMLLEVKRIPRKNSDFWWYKVRSIINGSCLRE